jgi:4-methyl-5(b-hydroxyethyl)-thiazole monophosphate biosynthesis
MTAVLVVLAEGCEEMEAVIVTDVLRRAGCEVKTVGIQHGPITASRGVRLLADMAWPEVDPAAFDAIFIPGGGGGVERLKQDPRVLECVRWFYDHDRYVAAVCAGPLVLQAAGILNEQQYTCYPGVEQEMTDGNHLDKAVVVDGRLITSQGPGTCFEFGLTLVREFCGGDKAEKISKAMVYNGAR